MSAMLAQQAVNGVAQGAVYALLALGFTLVYGVLELVNFAHFNVFTVGSFVGLFVMQAMGVDGQAVVLHGTRLVAVLACAFGGAMAVCGLLGVAIERVALRPLRAVEGPAAMITTIGVGTVLFNLVLLGAGAQARNYPDPLPPLHFVLGGATIGLRQVLVVAVAVALMAALDAVVRHGRAGLAMRAVAQDAQAARLMGVDVDRIVMLTFLAGSALAGAGGVVFGLGTHFTSFTIGFSTGLRAFSAAVLGGIGSVRGAMAGGLAIGLIEAFAGQFVGAGWADVVIFSLLVGVLVVRPTGFAGQMRVERA